MSNYSTHIEFPVTVEYACHDEDDGGREYPSTPAYVEIIAVTIGGVDVLAQMTEEQITSLEQEVEDSIPPQDGRDERYECSEVIQEDCE